MKVSLEIFCQVFKQKSEEMLTLLKKSARKQMYEQVQEKLKGEAKHSVKTQKQHVQSFYIQSEAARVVVQII